MKIVIERCSECGERHEGNWADGEAQKLLDKQVCFTCNFWLEKLNIKDDSRVARIDGSHYTIGDENKSQISSFRGFGGRRFQIEFFDGRKAVTTNLWYQGRIPEHFRERFPDNARFASGEEWVKVGDMYCLGPEPSEKSVQVEALLDSLTPSPLGRRGSIEEQRCSWCGGPADKFRDQLSIREYAISGLCQKCQDKTFKQQEEESE